MGGDYSATAYNLKSLRSAKNQVNIWGHLFSGCGFNK